MGAMLCLDTTVGLKGITIISRLLADKYKTALDMLVGFRIIIHIILYVTLPYYSGSRIPTSKLSTYIYHYILPTLQDKDHTSFLNLILHSPSLV